MMRTRYLLFGTNPNPATTDIGLLIIRLYAGLALALGHGLAKVPPQPGFVGMVEGIGVPEPGILVWVAMVAEFGGGLLIALGLLTRPAALLVTIHFTIVVTMAHAGDPFSRRELPLFFLASALLFFFAGAGRYSLDAVLGRRGR